MFIEMLKSKLHGARVTDANIHYEGSISIDRELCDAAGMFLHEKVDVLNITNGARLTTYIIAGGPGEICLNGAAARMAQPGDKVIIVSYASMTPQEAEAHHPRVILLDGENRPKA